jgi:L-threonylcarbamoyladenylate synthase
MIPLVPATSEHLSRAAAALQTGQLVALPTETVYGLGAKGWDPIALAKIFEAKRRPFFDPLILHIADREELPALVAPGAADTPLVRLLINRFWPGPLTLVLPKADAVPELATSGLTTVAVRMPAHPVARALIRAAGFPVAAPSANPFGRLSPTTALHVQERFTDGIAMIVDGGPCTIGVESTILSLAGERPVLLRSGGIPREELEAVIGPVERGAITAAVPAAPGQLEGHYAPRTPLRLLRSATRAPAGPASRTGYLGFRTAPPEGYARVELLSPTGDLREAAANLFAALHRLDAAGLAGIDAEPLPETGLGAAIMDRLRKAEAGSGDAH